MILKWLDIGFPTGVVVVVVPIGIRGGYGRAESVFNGFDAVGFYELAKVESDDGMFEGALARGGENRFSEIGGNVQHPALREEGVPIGEQDHVAGREERGDFFV